uniref:Uncharacterized protein n=1 Tax=Arundo donax TaxID=35708 RepID=A0A0A9C7I8_ARUDO
MLVEMSQALNPTGGTQSKINQLQRGFAALTF